MMKVHINKLFTQKQLVYLILCLFGCLYFTMVICNHYFFRTDAYDYGVYNFAFYDFAHFRISDCSVYQTEHVNFLQDHLSFTMFLFIPLYWIFGWLTGTYTLLFIQTTLILIGGWAIYRLVELKTKEKWFPALAILQYFLIFGRWTAFVSDCNLAIMAASVVPVLLYVFERKKFVLTALTLAFILITREDMALWTLFIGLFLFITHRKEKEWRWASGLIMITSVLYFIFAFKVAIPFFETPNKKFNLFNYSALGSTPFEALVFAIKHPLKTLELFFVNHSGNSAYNNVKFEFYYVYLLCGGFLLLFRPKYLLLFIPLLAKKMLNDDPVRWSIELYYSIEFVSILPVAVFLILGEFRNKPLKYSLAAAICAFTLTITIVKLTAHNRELNWWDDTKYAFYKKGMYQAGFDVSKVYTALSIIPADAYVSVNSNILPHFAFRKKVYNFPQVSDAEYIAILTNRGFWPLNKEEYMNEVKKYLSGKDWMLVIDQSPLLILKKRMPHTENHLK